MFQQVLVQEDNYFDHTLLHVPIFVPVPMHSIAQPARPQNGKVSKFLKKTGFVQTCLKSLSLPVSRGIFISYLLSEV